jgi:hypothetical protein
MRGPARFLLLFLSNRGPARSVCFFVGWAVFPCGLFVCCFLLFCFLSRIKEREGEAATPAVIKNRGTGSQSSFHIVSLHSPISYQKKSGGGEERASSKVLFNEPEDERGGMAGAADGVSSTLLFLLHPFFFCLVFVECYTVDL